MRGTPILNSLGKKSGAYSRGALLLNSPGEKMTPILNSSEKKRGRLFMRDTNFKFFGGKKGPLIREWRLFLIFKRIKVG